MGWQAGIVWQASPPSTEKGCEGWAQWEKIPGWVEYPEGQWVNHNNGFDDEKTHYAGDSQEDGTETYDMADSLKQACISLRGVSKILEEYGKINSNVVKSQKQ